MTEHNYLGDVCPLGMQFEHDRGFAASFHNDSVCPASKAVHERRADKL